MAESSYAESARSNLWSPCQDCSLLILTYTSAKRHRSILSTFEVTQFRLLCSSRRPGTIMGCSHLSRLRWLSGHRSGTTILSEQCFVHPSRLLPRTKPPFD